MAESWRDSHVFVVRNEDGESVTLEVYAASLAAAKLTALIHSLFLTKAQ